MRVILDFPGARQAFLTPRAIITADSAGEVPAALAAIQEALAAGRHVAGWLGYELGYALEPRLLPLLPQGQALLRMGVFDGPVPAPMPEGRAYAGPLMHDWDQHAYAGRFASVKEKIAAGDIYQANLSIRARFAFAGDALALYEALRRESRAPWCGFVDDGERQIASLSPELFFELSASGAIAARPMKGTAERRGDDFSESAALSASAKERAENLMIVDLIRNDLGRVAETGSVKVKALFDVETYPTLHAMVSTVSAKKRAAADLADILRALFPCGSVTGAPKIRAMQILRELEEAPRGAYCGAVGFFCPDGSARFNVAIRTLTLAGGRGELGIGGGVVQDSESAAEYAECRLKARFFEGGRAKLELIETLRWVSPGIAEGPVDLPPGRTPQGHAVKRGLRPESGFVRLDSHLARMAASAHVFGLAFDEASARAALTGAVAGRTVAQRVRLTLDEDGRHAASTAALEANPLHWTYAIARTRIRSTDLLQRHKTSWREIYEGEASLADEMLFLNERGELAEGARSNIFIARGAVLLTPKLESGVLDGRLRAELIAAGTAREAVLTLDDLKSGEVYCGNSLRGLIRSIPL